MVLDVAVVSAGFLTFPACPVRHTLLTPRARERLIALPKNRTVVDGAARR